VASSAAAPPPAARRGSGLVITEPVRSGQQVFYGEGDITVLSTVSSGAEIAATGHVHVYGPLRGRAFAGVEGDDRAMIFCDQLHAELLSIAGVYLVNEELDRDAVGRRVRVSSAGERLFVTSVS
jgi:septum site-determining protein MinC